MNQTVYSDDMNNFVYTDTPIIVLTCALVILSIVSIALHSVGIHLIRNTSSLLHPNDRLYLINLSLVEIVKTILQNNNQICLMSENQVLAEYAVLTIYLSGFPWIYLMVMLTIDRLLRVHFSLRYNVIITPKKTKAIIASCYAVGTALAIALIILYVKTDNSLQIIRKFVHPLHGCIHALTFLITYSYIYCKIRRGRRSTRVSSSNNRIRHNKSSIFVPFWITLKFIVLIIIPGIFSVFLQHLVRPRNVKFLHIAWRLTWVIDFITDAMIYIFLNDVIRDKFYRWVKNSVSS